MKVVNETVKNLVKEVMLEIPYVQGIIVIELPTLRLIGRLAEDLSDEICLYRSKVSPKNLIRRY